MIFSLFSNILSFFNPKPAATERPFSGTSGPFTMKRMAEKEPEKKDPVEAGNINVTGTGITQQTVAELVPRALTRALNDYIRNELEFLVAATPTHRFQLQEIRVRLTSGNMALLQPIANLPEKMRNTLAENCLKATTNPDVFHLGKFYGFRILQDPPAVQHPDSQVYRQLAGISPHNIELFFSFIGEWIEVEEGEKEKPGSQSGSHPTPSSGVCHPVSNADPLPLARFIVENANGTTSEYRVFHRREFPLHIGRDSHSDVRIDSNFVSREHLTVTEDRAGTVKIQSTTDKGLAVKKTDGKIVDVAQGESVSLTSGDRLVLSPSAGKDAVMIRCEIFRFPSDNQQTVIALPPSMRASESETALPERETTTSAKKPAETVAPEPEPAVHQDDPHRSAMQTVMPEEAVRHDGRSTMQTVMPAAVQHRAPLARLEVRYPDGRTSTMGICSLPFEIGRDPLTEDCLVIEDPNTHVSRQHLHVEKIQDGCLYIENLAVNKAGTFKEDGKPCLEIFSLTPQDGWIYLAGRGAKASVQLRMMEI